MTLLGTTVLAKSIEKNSKQWEKMDSQWHDQFKKDDSLHCSIKAASHSFMSLSIPKLKKSDRAGQNILSDVRLSFTSRVWGSKNQIQNFSLNLLYNGPANIPPNILAFPPTTAIKLLVDMTASTVSFQCCCRQAGLWLWVPDTILPPGKRIIRVKRQPCSVRCKSETRTYVEFCGLPQKSSSSSNGSDSDNNRERHILETLERS